MVHYVCSMLCLGLSAFYHMFNAHSHKVMNLMIRLDYSGICFIIAGSCTSAIYYSFACPQLEEWRNFYLTIMWSSSMLTLLIMMIPAFDEYFMLRFCLFFITGILNQAHVSHSQNLPPEYMIHFPLKTWWMGGVLYILGATILGLRIPERFVSRTFDIFGSSHQLHHCFCLTAALIHFYASIQVFHER